MATVTYRRLDANYDPVRGQGQHDFVEDIHAVAQAIKTRLNLWLNEWWEDLADGLPMMEGILGVMGAARSGHAALLLQQRILDTPYVMGLSNVLWDFNASSRAFSFQCEASVSFSSGTVKVVGTFNKDAGSSLAWTVTAKGA